MNKNEQEFLIQKIRTQYTEKEHTDLDELKELDAKVKRPANVFGYALGTTGSLVMGVGMSLVMTDVGSVIGIKNSTTPGIIIGILGMAMTLANYPIYKKILNSRKEKYSSKILELSEKLMES